MANKALFDQEATDASTKGMKIVYDAVSRTMGAGGGNVIYRKYGKVEMTNDGKTIGDRLHPENEAEAMGADLLKQAANRTNEEAGDGTSTSTVLGYTMVNVGLDKIKAGHNSMALRREMEVALPKIIKEIQEASTPIKSDDELLHIANISVENIERAKLVRDAVKRVGIDGIVILDESTGVTIEKEEVDGLRFDRGYTQQFMMTSPEKEEAVLENAHILITDKNLMLNKDAIGILNECVKQGIRELLIIADDVGGEFLATLFQNRIKGVFHAVVVKKPYYREVMEDIAVLTGATTITNEKGIQEITADHFSYIGKAQRVIVKKDSCLIINGKGDKEKIKERIAAVKNDIKGAEAYEKNNLKNRLARLVGGVVIIRVGAPTEAEMKYLYRKIEDAVNATKAAMEEGVVVGGGRLLYDISLKKSDSIGEEVIRRACWYPMYHIITNAGGNVDDIVPKLKAGEVFDAVKAEIVADPIKEGIIDPTKVERCALANAVSFASSFLTSHCLIEDIPEPSEKGENMV